MKMIAVNETTLGELLEMLECNPAEEIFLTNSGKAKFKLIRVDSEAPVKEILPRELAFGYGKGKHKLPDDFDEQFVAMDAEIWREVADSYEVSK